jgi:uncharacterized protein
MLLLLSPAKKQDFSPSRPTLKGGVPRFAAQAGELVEVLRGYRQEDLQALMGVSESLAKLNVDRYQSFSVDRYDKANAKPAVLAFQGDAYRGLGADTLTDDQLVFAQGCLRILSGLYGVLRPLDFIQAYRLEMKIRLATSRGANLYAYWGGALASALNQDLAGEKTPVVINLASQEYFKAVDLSVLQARLITVDFKVDKGEGPKTIGIYAKKARGMMARYVIERGLTEPEALCDFNQDGYRFSKAMSAQDIWVFVKRV